MNKLTMAIYSLFSPGQSLGADCKERKFLKIGSLNVKNIESNKAYVTKLLQSYDVLAVQEHWLFTFQLSDFDASFVTTHTAKQLAQKIHYLLLRNPGAMVGLPSYTRKI